MALVRIPFYSIVLFIDLQLGFAVKSAMKLRKLIYKHKANKSKGHKRNLRSGQGLFEPDFESIAQLFKRATESLQWLLERNFKLEGFFERDSRDLGEVD